LNRCSHAPPSHDCLVAACGGVGALCPKISIIKADTAYAWHWLGTCNWGHVLEAHGISERRDEPQLFSRGRV